MASMINKPYPDSSRNDSGLAFVRIEDGDMMLMFDIAFAYHPHDKTSWRGGKSKLGQDLRAGLAFPKYQYNSNSPFYYGIYDVKRICPIHNFLTMIHQDIKYLTYANLFVNSNYPATKILFRSLMQDQMGKIVLNINNGTDSSKLAELSKWACEILLYPDNGPSMWEDIKLREQAVTKIIETAKRYNNRLFAFSVGYLTRVLIHYAWQENPYNRYIDFGSALDEITKNKITRPYQSNPGYYADPTYILHYKTTGQKFDITVSNYSYKFF
ncbi:unnamed protein product [Adineta steineri]|uniref:Uncharacterized protein n=1 Tax=Adineta steineri TaxID=433720 RepID=A0A819AWP9_9BILA|nr:unnamed protein product [Adineta steineri]CAF3794182.1 unnamed protein product [Adineta steineri]